MLLICHVCGSCISAVNDNDLSLEGEDGRPEAGLDLESEATYQRQRSLTATFFTLKPTLSPDTDSGRDSWSILGDTSLETTLGRINNDDQDGNIGLGGTGDHALDKITVSRDINGSEGVLCDWNFHRAMSTVISRSGSALRLSRTQAYSKDPFPRSAASFSNFFMVDGCRLPSNLHWVGLGLCARLQCGRLRLAVVLLESFCNRKLFA